MKKSSAILALSALLVLAGCSSTSSDVSKAESDVSQTASEVVSDTDKAVSDAASDVNKTVSGFDDETYDAIQDFRTKADDVYNDMQDLAKEGLSDSGFDSAKAKFIEDYDKIYADGSEEFQKVYDGLKDHPDQQAAMEKIKADARDFYDKISDEALTAADAAKLDISGMTQDMRDFNTKISQALGER